MRSLLIVLVILGACGGAPPVPKRGVVEADLGGWKFRRFQGPLLDVEVWIDGNQGQAFSASYITTEAEKRGHIDDKDLVNVTVTKYASATGVVRETVKLVRRLAQEKGYQVDEDKIRGVRALTVKGPGEAWVIWPSTTYVVKVGGQGRTDVPAAMVESYGERFPSRLPGGSLEGPLPPGPDNAPKTKGDKPAYDPDNPTPDIDHYDPKNVKIPEKTIQPEQVPDEAPADDPKSGKHQNPKKKKKTTP